MKVYLSNTTRQRAMQALQSLDTESLLDVVKVTPVNQFYIKSLDESLMKDQERNAAVFQRSDILPQDRNYARQTNFTGEIKSKGKDSLKVEIPRLAAPGGKRISNDHNYGTEVTLHRGSQYYDNKVEQPTMPKATVRPQSKKALDEVFEAEETSNNDLGGSSGYGA